MNYTWHIWEGKHLIVHVHDDEDEFPLDGIVETRWQRLELLSTQGSWVVKNSYWRLNGIDPTAGFNQTPLIIDFNTGRKE